MRRYDHVIFDLDGTLADTAADLGAATNHMLTEMGRPPLTLAVVRTYVGAGARKLVERALGGGSEVAMEQGLSLFLEYYRAHLLDQTRPYPGIGETLAALRACGVTMSVLTNKPFAMSHAILRGLELLSNFLMLIGGDSLAVRKPDPSGVTVLIEAAHVVRERTLLVGDSPIDAQTARSAAVAFAGVTWGFAGADLRGLPQVDLVDTPAQLLATVGVAVP